MSGGAKIQVPLRTGIAIGWAAIALFTVIPRALCVPRVREDNLTPDGARYLNLARCLERGEGFSTPEAWPAWMNPAKLPMPETFKEPGYPAAIAALTPVARSPFRAAQAISLVCGVLLPFAVYRLGRRLSPDPWIGVGGAVFAAASPLLIQQSVYVMAESSLTLLLTLALLAAAPRSIDPARFEPQDSASVSDFLAGLCFGLAFLIRAQAALAIPAIAALLLIAASFRVALMRAALATLGGLLALLPFMARNLREFGTLFHSDVGAFGLWPYVDQFALTHSLERPPSAIGYALAHVPQVAAHFAHGLAQFVEHDLTRELTGNILLLIPLALGAYIAARRWRVWGFALLYLVPTGAFILSLNWVARYFASIVPLLALMVALGVRRIFEFGFVKRYSAGFLGGIHVGLTIQVAYAISGVAPTYTPELAAARAEAPFLRARLAPNEAVMAELTSYWAWWSDRPAVYPVVADSTRFLEVMRRLRVRYAALPTSRLAEFATHYPGGHLPAALVVDHAEPDLDVTVFQVRTN